MANINLNFHSQLRSIIDTLALAAVKEISDLVDDGFAILRLEISESQKENEALQNKLQIMELQIARGCEEESVLRELLAKCRCGRVQDGDHPFQLFESHMDLARGSDEKPSVEDDDPLTQHSAILGKCTDMEERSTDLALIKKERVEEDKDTLEEMNSREKRSVERRAGSREKCPIQEMQNKAANHTEELTEQHRTRRAVWEASGQEQQSLTSLPVKLERPEEVLESSELEGDLGNCGKGFAELGCVTCTTASHTAWEVGHPDLLNQRVQHRNEDGLRPKSICKEHPGLQRALLPQMTSNDLESDLEKLQVPSEPQLGPMMAESCGDHPSAPSCIQRDSELTLMDFVPTGEQDGAFAVWNEAAISERVPPQHGLYSELHDKDEVQPEDARDRAVSFTHRVRRGNTAASTDTSMTACAPLQHLTTSNNCPVRERTGTKVKKFSRPTFDTSFGFQQSTLAEQRPFSCMQCDESFDKFQELEGHQRVHTGEKPFVCAHCGKSFSYHHQLKTHQRVHTGEKPFSCAQCGKRFTQSSHIKRHESVHTGEKRFICKLCGKRFSQSCGLKTHQAVHTGEKPYSCSHCGKRFSILGNLLRHQIVHTRK